MAMRRHQTPTRGLWLLAVLAVVIVVLLVTLLR
jgi:hypothetical protein